MAELIESGQALNKGYKVKFTTFLEGYNNLPSFHLTKEQNSEFNKLFSKKSKELVEKLGLELEKLNE